MNSFQSLRKRVNVQISYNIRKSGAIIFFLEIKINGQPLRETPHPSERLQFFLVTHSFISIRVQFVQLIGSFTQFTIIVTLATANESNQTAVRDRVKVGTQITILFLNRYNYSSNNEMMAGNYTYFSHSFFFKWPTYYKPYKHLFFLDLVGKIVLDTYTLLLV